MYLITEEKKQGGLAGALHLQNKEVRIYYILGNMDLKRFQDGIICEDINQVFEILEKVLRYANRDRIQ